MFRLVFLCQKCNVHGLVGAITKYCNAKGFHDYLVSDYKFSRSYGVDVRIALSQRKYKTLCPDDVRNELFCLVTKYNKSSHLIAYVFKDTSLFNSL